MVENGRKATDLQVLAWASLYLLTPCACSCHYAHFTEDQTEAQGGLVTCPGLLSNGKAGIPETCIPDSKSRSLNTQGMQTTRPAPGTFYVLRGHMLHLRSMFWYTL